MTRRLVGLAVTAVLTAAAASRPVLPAAPAPACEFSGVDRVVAIGDIHGAYDRFVAILRTAGLVDARLRWSGGKTHLVQLGDVVDRGPDSRKALDFLQRLAKDAQAAGGRVHALLGNHEVLRMLADFRYVSPGEYAAFATADSESLRNRFLDSRPAANRESLLQQTPLGLIEMVQAFGPDGDYGSRFRDQNAVVRINDVMFMHGGLSPALAAESCSSINDRIRKELSTTASIQQTKNAPKDTLSSSADGPLWYRGLAEEPDTFAPDVDKILDAQHARAIVVAHTVRTSGRIEARFSGKVFLIDTGMQPAYVSTGRASALDIRGEVFTAIYEDSQQVLRRNPGGVR